MKRLLVVIPLALMLITSGSCLPTDDVIEGEGTIHHGVGPECPGTWRVTSSDGRMLWPVEDPAFQQEGLRVRFTAQARGEASICMAGTPVKFVSLQKI
jgi:hypothetical protein